MTPPNNWEIRKCLRLSLAILLALLGLVGLASLGFDIPGLRQIVGFIFLTFVPGILILRTLRIHNISAVECLLYSVGLSIAFVMLTGLFANFALPLLGISKPISLWPITTSLAIFTLILGAVAYKRDKEVSASAKDCFVEFPRIARDRPRNNRGESRFLWLPYLLLLMLPLLAIFGALLMNFYQNNFLLLFFIIVIGCVVALVAFDRLPRNAYPLAIVMIGLSLLLHVSLISPQLVGGDIHVEYYFQNLVVQNSYWDFTTPHNYNTALSIVLLCPIYSLILNMDATWVFKIVYPLLFCFVPLVLFHIFREQIGAKKAFFAAFFFMSVMTFITLMPQLTKQQIAELFFALLILLLIDRKLALNQRATLAVIFAVSLIMSHYALGYICMAFLVAGWGIVVLIRSHAGRGAWGWLTRKFGGLPQSLASQGAFPHKIMAVIIGIYLVFALSWYGGIAQGTALNTIKNIGQSQYSLLSTELPGLVKPGEPGGPGEPSGKFFDPTEREALIGTALGLDFPAASPLGKGFRIFQYLTELFIVVGLFTMIFKPRGFKFRAEYIALSIVAALILLACIVVPRFSSYLCVERFYHISLFLLAPLFVLGGEAIWHGASRLVSSVSSRAKVKRGLALTIGSSRSPAYSTFLALAILMPYFLFNSGFFFEVTGSQRFAVNDSPSSMALSSYRLDMAVFSQKDAEATTYLTQVMDDDDIVYADRWGWLIIADQLSGQVRGIRDSGEVPEDAYIFLRTWNVDKQEILIVVFHRVQTESKHINLSELPALLEGRKLIYDNSGAQIWAPR